MIHMEPNPNRRIGWITGAILALVVVAGLWYYFWPEGQPDKDSRPQLSLRLKWIWYAGWAGELLAEQRELWRAEGLDVQVRPGGFELDPIKLVAAGSDPIGVAGADQILLAREKGIPLVAFAVQYQEAPVGFVAMSDSGIKSIKDFRGHKIGVKFGTDVEPIYRALLKKESLLPTDVTEVPVKFDLGPFFSRAIDVYPGYLTNDLLMPAERGYNVNTIGASEYGVNVYGNVYFTTEQYLSTHRDEIVKFLRGVRAGWLLTRDVPASEIADLALKKNTGLNREHEIKVVEAVKHFVFTKEGTFGTLRDDKWKALYDLLRDQALIRNEFDFGRAYTTEILDAAGKTSK